MPLKPFVFAACLILMFALFVERTLLRRARKQIKTVIHVNGTRGKSTIVRLIDAGLRGNLPVAIYSKITGTKPAVINSKGDLTPIKRRGQANINEQVKQLISAAKQGAEIFIVECMAVQPELQQVCEEKILKANILVLSNVRNDHIPEMGRNLTEVARSFALTFPNNGKIFTAEGRYNSIFEEVAEARNSQLVIVPRVDSLSGLENWPPFLKDNIALALAVCEELGVKEADAWSAMKNYLPDPYAFKEYHLSGGAIFANALTANDPESTNIIFSWLRAKTEIKDRELIILLNCREDRPARTREMLSWIEQQEAREVWILGRRTLEIKSKTAAKKFHYFYSVEKLPFKQLQGDEFIFAVGNVGESGFELLELIEERSL